MKFADFMCEAAISSHLTAEDKESVIEEMVDSLVSAGQLGEDDRTGSRAAPVTST